MSDGRTIRVSSPALSKPRPKARRLAPPAHTASARDECDTFYALADPVRRAALEALAQGDLSSGELTGRLESAFALTRVSVSRHLRILKDAGLVRVRVDAQRRIYVLDAPATYPALGWLDRICATPSTAQRRTAA